MGLAIAAAAQARGAEVDLVVTATVSPLLVADAGVEPTAVVERAADLAAAVGTVAGHCDVVVMAAAVSEFTFAGAGAREDSKLERGGAMTLQLEPTEDIIARLARERGGAERPLIVGFAAETGSAGLERARAKRERKGIDVIVHNDVARADIGFESRDNEVTILDAAGEQHVGPAP
jgi:phosphopantothenoylcysteine decarboxylase/phosphopantothenate--cysteine ligase